MGLGRVDADLSSRASATSAGHLHIDQRDVGFGVRGHLDRLVGVLRRPHHLDGGIGRQEVDECLTDGLLVFRDEHADTLHDLLGSLVSAMHCGPAMCLRTTIDA